MPHFVPVTLGSPQFRTRTTRGFNVVHAWFPAGTWLSPHEHEHTNFAVMLNGSFDLTLMGRTVSCPPGTALVEPQGERHANLIGSRGAEVVVIQPNAASDELLGPAAGVLRRPGHTHHGGLAVKAAAIRQELDLRDPFSTLALEGLALEMVADLARSPGRGLDAGSPPRWMVGVLERLHDDTPTSLRIEDLSSHAGVDPLTLARTFRRHCRMPIGRYARQLRLDRCALALRTTTESIAGLAIRAGFADQSHLTRSFRQRFGVTPDAYRRIHGRPEHGRLPPSTP